MAHVLVGEPVSTSPGYALEVGLRQIDQDGRQREARKGQDDQSGRRATEEIAAPCAGECQMVGHGRPLPFVRGGVAAAPK